MDLFCSNCTSSIWSSCWWRSVREEWAGSAPACWMNCCRLHCRSSLFSSSSSSCLAWKHMCYMSRVVLGPSLQSWIFYIKPPPKLTSGLSPNVSRSWWCVTTWECRTWLVPQKLSFLFKYNSSYLVYILFVNILFTLHMYRNKAAKPDCTEYTIFLQYDKKKHYIYIYDI